MQLKNMQDIGGCRAIVSNSKKVSQIVRELKKNKVFRNGNGKFRYKDYIKKPKDDGYRGYHLIGKFADDAGNFRNIELQIRTRLQHDWATTLEIVDLFTGQALKSNQGERDWKVFFSSISEQFALMEDIHLFDTLDFVRKKKVYEERRSQGSENTESYYKVIQQARKLKVVETLNAFAHSLKIVDGRLEEESHKGYVLLEVDIMNAVVASTLFTEKESENAEKEYTTAEKNAANQNGLVVALVSTTAVGGIKEAYPNYFADSTEFIGHLQLIVN